MGAMAGDEVKDREGLEQGEQYPPLKIVEPLKGGLPKNIKQFASRIFGLLMRGSQEIGLQIYKVKLII